MENLLIIIIRTYLGYAFLFLLMKLMGKREIGQLSLFDLIIILSIADIMVIGIDQFNENILYSFIPMLIVALSQKLIAYVSLKWSKMRTIIDGRESYIIINGKLNVEEMKKQRYNMDDLYSQLREQGIRAIAEINDAVLEASGKLSVFKKDSIMDASFPIIVSGKINQIVLKISKHGEDWLEKELAKQNVKLQDVLGANIIDGKLVLVETIKL